MTEKPALLALDHITVAARSLAEGVAEGVAATESASAMADLGCALLRFEVEHPAADVIAESLAPHLTDERLIVRAGPQKRLTALIATPHGPRVLR